MPITKIPKLPDNLITSDKIVDNTIVNADVSPSAGIANSKTVSLGTISSTLTSACASLDKAKTNISLLGFKMAVNESLTIFNLVDGVVDEFSDESGTDESEGSNDLYNSSCDYYINSTQPDGQSLCLSAGFTVSSITEPDTSTTGTNPAQKTATFGSFTVPTGVTAVDIKVWGAGGGGSTANTYYPGDADKYSGGGGGYAEGTLAVTGSQVLHVIAGEHGTVGPQPGAYNGAGYKSGGDGTGEGGGGGGLSGVFTTDLGPLSNPQYSAPQAYVVAGSGGGGGACGNGGAGGGLTGDAGGQTTEQTDAGGSAEGGGGGGDQEQGGQGGSGNPSSYSGASGQLFNGEIAGNPTPSAGLGGGGSGFYGGGGGAYRIPGQNLSLSGGGGSSYYGHPQITSGSTEEGSACEAGGTAIPQYVACTSESAPQVNGEDGYVFINACQPATATSTTIISTSFSATSVPSTSRIVVFEENIDTPTLNTDIIASISRDGGSTYTTATLSDSGYVTGSSGQRILTGQATISGQPSGQSMRWKLALANNQVKIHGVSLSWA